MNRQYDNMDLNEARKDKQKVLMRKVKLSKKLLFVAGRYVSSESKLELGEYFFTLLHCTNISMKL